MSEWHAGKYRADCIIAEAPGELAHWLDRARQDRAQWRTRLFDRRKRHFLNGFIAALETHLKRSAN
jgi:hypothetical protein